MSDLSLIEQKKLILKEIGVTKNIEFSDYDSMGFALFTDEEDPEAEYYLNSFQEVMVSDGWVIINITEQNELLREVKKRNTKKQS